MKRSLTPTAFLVASSFWVVAMSLLVPSAVGQEAVTPPAAAPAISARGKPGEALMAPFTANDRGADAIAKIEPLLAAATKAYHDAPTLRDLASLVIVTPQGTQQDSYRLFFGPGTDAQLSLAGATMTALGDKVTVVLETPSDRALQVPLVGNINSTLQVAMPGFQMPVPHFALRYGQSVTVQDLAMAVLVTPQFAGLREADGLAELLLEGSNGAVVVQFDGASKLVKRMQAAFAPDGAPAGFVVSFDLGFEPIVADALVPPITVDLATSTGGARSIVTSFQDLQPKPLAVGDKSPEWTMTAMDGSSVSLGALRGSVVVIDFWATWCGPCKRGLPYIEEFAKWASSSGKAIRVFGVNTLEPGSVDERNEKASAWWREQKFTMPLLLDSKDAVSRAYGVRGIPMTIVIGPDGTITAMHAGLAAGNPGQIVEDLKSESEQALAGPKQ